MIVWNNDMLCSPRFSQPDSYRWEKESDEWIPVTTKEFPAPDAIVEMVKGGYRKD